MMSATSASQRTESSKAFLSSPFLLFEKVTCLLESFSILFIWAFPLTIFVDFEENISNPSEKKEQNPGFWWKIFQIHQFRDGPVEKIAERCELWCLIWCLNREISETLEWSSFGARDRERRHHSTVVSLLLSPSTFLLVLLSLKF